MARFARIIEIEHGRDSVNAKTVDVEFIQPEEGVGNEEVLNFVAAIVIDERAPVGMRALARIFVLVEMRAVEEGEAVSVAGEVRRGPIE